MLNQIALITILTDDVPRLAAFYHDVLGFEVKQDLGGYVEFHHDGVRFALCARSIMHDASGHASYAEAQRGQALNWLFLAANPPRSIGCMPRSSRRAPRPFTPPPICRGASAPPCSPIPTATSTNCLPICPDYPAVDRRRGTLTCAL